MQPFNNLLSNIPLELQALPQWVVSNDPIRKIPLDPKTGKPAAVNNPNTWGTFQQAVVCRCRFIGFVFTTNDPYCVIDLDDKKDDPATPEQRQRFEAIISTFNTYTEISQSGRGVHVICKGVSGEGKKREHVELYDRGRYVIFTGNVLVNQPIKDCSHLVTPMYEQMRKDKPIADLAWLPAIQSDQEVLNMAQNAVNGSGEKFRRLWTMECHAQQNEDDFALLSLLAFYSKSDEQVIRLFRQSGLGKRKKAYRDDYVHGSLSKIRGSFKSELPEIDFSKLTFERKKVEHLTGIDWPPGLMGEIAKYIFNTSNRPAKEISIAAAIGFVTGIIARAYNISNTGLNQYIMVIAGTGRGKEEMRKGIDRIVNEVRNRTLLLNTPGTSLIDEFIGPGDFSSGQGMGKYIAKKPSCFSILGEFGKTLKEMTGARIAPQAESLKKVMLKMYNASGHTDTLPGTAYSQSENSVSAVRAPNLTMLCEGSTESFFESIDQQHILDGLFPRFLFFEFDGLRQYHREVEPHAPPEHIIEGIILLAQIAYTAKQNETCCNIPQDAAAKAIFKEYDITTTDDINDNSQDRATKELWNRAHVKALKLAGALAVGINPHNPLVTAELAEYAINVVNTTTRSIVGKYSSGEMGDGDHRQENDIIKCFETYFDMPAKKRQTGYKIPEALAKYKEVVPSYFLKKYLKLRSSFKNDRRGAYGAIEVMVNRLIRDGIISQVSTEQALTQFETKSTLYTKGHSWQD